MVPGRNPAVGAQGSEMSETWGKVKQSLLNASRNHRPNCFWRGSIQARPRGETASSCTALSHPRTHGLHLQLHCKFSLPQSEAMRGSEESQAAPSCYF
ncbi:hypothetical protein VZT92_007896 [Zoarces viviparus]|uniref:Uncharacterized protein n=1 Tax=Zoarces viviparus TaxID=48416 RepID=A0AAW1FLH5_ZOAVI